MNVGSWKLALAALLAVLLVACAQPVRNVDGVQVVASKPDHSLEDVTLAIRRAAGALGWRTEVESPGHVVASIALRTHTASVDIRYTTQRYSIQYRDSTNLGYDGTNIHKNYNGWIQNLERDINFHLGAM